MESFQILKQNHAKTPWEKCSFWTEIDVFIVLKAFFLYEEHRHTCFPCFFA